MKALRQAAAKQFGTPYGEVVTLRTFFLLPVSRGIDCGERAFMILVPVRRQCSVSG